MGMNSGGSEAASAAAAGAAAGGSMLKLWGAPIVAAALAIAIGFTYMWPESKREGFKRMFLSLIASFFFGPVLVIALHSVFPSLFLSARALGMEYAGDATLGLFFIAAPILVMPALASWWIFGAIVVWFQRRKDKDIGELATDAAQTVKGVKGSI